jgi:hypothetical protein
MAREDEPGHKKLVAYIVPREREDSPSLTCESILSSSSRDSFSVLAGETLPAVSEILRNHLLVLFPTIWFLLSLCISIRFLSPLMVRSIANLYPS